MKKLAIEYLGNRLRICFCGIKFSFKLKWLFFLSNKLVIKKSKSIKRVYSCPKGVKIKFSGCNAYVELAEGKYENCLFDVAENSKVIIDTPHKWGCRGLKLYVGKDCEVHIKEGFNSVDVTIIAIDCASKVIIGKNCMFSTNICIRTHDGHAIYSLKDKKAFNHPKDIVIGDNVWIGSDVRILKGVSIAKNTVVGTGAIILKSINQENVIVGGIPAKIIKENIGWDRRRYSEYELENKEFDI